MVSLPASLYHSRLGYFLFRCFFLPPEASGLRAISHLPDFLRGVIIPFVVIPPIPASERCMFVAPANRSPSTSEESCRSEGLWRGSPRVPRGAQRDVQVPVDAWIPYCNACQSIAPHVLDTGGGNIATFSAYHHHLRALPLGLARCGPGHPHAYLGPR